MTTNGAVNRNQQGHNLQEIITSIKKNKQLYNLVHDVKWTLFCRVNI